MYASCWCFMKLELLFKRFFFQGVPVYICKQFRYQRAICLSPYAISQMSIKAHSHVHKPHTACDSTVFEEGTHSRGHTLMSNEH